ncbi:MAG: putative universal stress protein [Elusimicrobia bacterium]|nr:putative universal stress protein [Elusimicrobiota bacterium]
MMRLKKILVPVDFSKEAELAVKWAVKLAKEENKSTIYLLNVLYPIAYVPEVGYDIENIVKDQIREAKEKLKKWQKIIPPQLISKTLCVEGDLAKIVQILCEKENIDLVVMTTRGRRGLSRVAHPNVSEKIVRTAPCPVLVLHLNPKMEMLAKKK